MSTEAKTLSFKRTEYQIREREKLYMPFIRKEQKFGPVLKGLAKLGASKTSGILHNIHEMVEEGPENYDEENAVLYQKIEFLNHYDAENEDYVENWHDADLEKTDDKAGHYRRMYEVFSSNYDNFIVRGLNPHHDGIATENKAMYDVALLAAELSLTIPEAGYESEQVKELEAKLRDALRTFRICRVSVLEELNHSCNHSAHDPKDYFESEILLFKPFTAKDVFRMDSFDDFNEEKSMFIWVGNVTGEDMSRYYNALLKFGFSPRITPQPMKPAAYRYRLNEKMMQALTPDDEKAECRRQIEEINRQITNGEIEDFYTEEFPDLYNLGRSPKKEIWVKECPYDYRIDPHYSVMWFINNDNKFSDVDDLFEELTGRKLVLTDEDGNMI